MLKTSCRFLRDTGQNGQDVKGTTKIAKQNYLAPWKGDKRVRVKRVEAQKRRTERNTQFRTDRKRGRLTHGDDTVANELRPVRTSGKESLNKSAPRFDRTEYISPALMLTRYTKRRSNRAPRRIYARDEIRGHGHGILSGSRNRRAASTSE